ncbi:FAD-binding oxidoreductase [Mucilaginibacter flavus]|uniref:FAD-binding oxidoreductase n=1 Tax=Mucilaginibacter flavus TaxID=931504 RepID=UPI0025B4727F|nr:FAD-binding oxidoreductase [Mucilaginibacter flavus]MDN3583691.1 FAD-binding oxidoreductase [Mucilaginibacter flavus]
METIVNIISAQYVTHNVKQFRLQKPAGFTFTPGQATELSVNHPDWKDKKNPFTFTSLAHDPYLEFTIKIYPDSPEGVTNQLSKLVPGDELILRDAWGAIEYKGPGYFIAGGAGITPFIAILRDLNNQRKLAGNKLFFSNKTDKDIILADELKSMLGPDAVFLISGQKDSIHDTRRIDEAFLKAEVSDFTKHFYVCGPDAMVEEINGILSGLGADADSVVFEK